MKAHLPAPTIWPIALAAGVSLLAAGLLTHWIVGVAGALLTLVSLAAWVSLLVRDEP